MIIATDNIVSCGGKILMETAAGGVGKTSVCLTYFILFILVRERERVEREKGRDGDKSG